MTIAQGQLIQTQNPGNAQALVQSFIARNITAGTTNNYNDGIAFATNRLPVQTIPAGGARTAAEAYYLPFFAGDTSGIAPGISDSNFPTNPSVISASDGSYLSTTGYSNVFFRETQRYLVFRQVSATTVVAGNIPPAGTYPESGKGYVAAAEQPGSGAMSNPASNAGLAAARIISADTTGTVSGYSAQALNGYWDDLKAAFAATITNYTIATFNTCHGSCHGSCHGQRGRR